MSAQRMLETLRPSMMHADYRAGMSLSQVGAKWRDYFATTGGVDETLYPQEDIA